MNKKDKKEKQNKKGNSKKKTKRNKTSTVNPVKKTAKKNINQKKFQDKIKKSNSKKTATSIDKINNNSRKNAKITKKNANEKFPDNILIKSHLGIMKCSLTQMKICELLSIFIYRNKSGRKKIQNACIYQLKLFYDKDEFPIEIEFLSKHKDFFNFFIENWYNEVFDILNFLLFAFFIGYRFEILFLSKMNQNSYTTILNAKNHYIIYFCALLEEDGEKFNYLCLEKLFCDDHDKKMARKTIDDMRKKVKSFHHSDLSKEIDVLRNINFKKNKKERENNQKENDGLEYVKKIDNFDKVEVKKNKEDEEINNQKLLEKFTKLFKKHCQAFHLLYNEYQKLKINEYTLNSAQKQLSNVFNFYTKSVTKNSVNSNLKAFTFKEDDVVTDFTANLQYTNFPPNVFINMKPPGLPFQIYQNNIKIFNPKKDDEKEQASKSNTKKKKFFSNTEKKQRCNKLEKNKRYFGKMKNFYINRNYGFLIIKEYNEDVFVHYNDLEKAGITYEEIKDLNELTLSFEIMEYKIGYETHEKAVNLKQVN